jgi:hypothetical protein
MSDDGPGAERRVQRYHREAVRLPVRISSIDAEVDPETGKPFFLTAEEMCGDISRGGAFIMTQEPPRPGARLLVELELPGGEAVQTVARVAWTRVRFPSEGSDVQTGFGLEFLGGARRHLAAIERFVNGPTPAKLRTPGKGPAATPGAGPSA